MFLSSLIGPGTPADVGPLTTYSGGVGRGDRLLKKEGLFAQHASQFHFPPSEQIGFCTQACVYYR
jgi:hypothetical protein